MCAVMPPETKSACHAGGRRAALPYSCAPASRATCNRHVVFAPRYSRERCRAPILLTGAAGTTQLVGRTIGSGGPLRSLLARWLGVATVVGALLCAGILVYGLVEGPPAPIRQVADGYRDRLGNTYTAADYARFQQWKRVLFSAFAATFIAGFGWVLLGRKQRRPGELQADDRVTLESAVDHIERVFPDVAAELRARGPLARPRDGRKSKPDEH